MGKEKFSLKDYIKNSITTPEKKKTNGGLKEILEQTEEKIEKKPIEVKTVQPVAPKLKPVVKNLDYEISTAKRKEELGITSTGDLDLSRQRMELWGHDILSGEDYLIRAQPNEPEIQGYFYKTAHKLDMNPATKYVSLNEKLLDLIDFKGILSGFTLDKDVELLPAGYLKLIELKDGIHQKVDDNFYYIIGETTFKQLVNDLNKVYIHYFGEEKADLININTNKVLMLNVASRSYRASKAAYIE